MAVAYQYPTTPLVGGTFDRRTLAGEFELGHVVHGAEDTIWVYGQATEAVTGTCTLNTTTFAITDVAGNHTATAAFAANEYGWVRQTAVVSA